MAPELFDMEHAGPEITRPSEASDIYALGMVVTEVHLHIFSVFCRNLRLSNRSLLDNYRSTLIVTIRR